MKIASIDVIPVSVPRHPVAGISFPPTGVAVVRMRTDTGLEGIGHTLSLTPALFRTLVTAVQELGELLIGEDPREPEKLSRKLMFPANWIGPGGVLDIAAAGLDVAVWDLIGKDAGVPLYRLLGGYRNRARVYNSGALVGPLDVDSIQREAADAVKLGYKAIKMRPGDERHGPVRLVASRVMAVREAIGPNVELMLDINQTFTPSRAIQLGRLLEPVYLSWIEDPTLMHDVAAQANIAASLDMPVCSGEYHYGLPPLLRLLQSKAVDILMVDLMRVGGITQFRKAAGMAEAFGTPVVSHLLPEVYAHLIAAIPNGLMVEGMPWTQDLFHGLPELEEGDLVLSERPGHGLTLDETFVQMHRAN